MEGIVQPPKRVGQEGYQLIVLAFLPRKIYCLQCTLCYLHNRHCFLDTLEGIFSGFKSEKQKKGNVFFDVESCTKNQVRCGVVLQPM